jgi:hypothetical protein
MCEYVLQLQLVHLCAVYLAEADKVAELDGEAAAGCRERDAYVVEAAVVAEQKLFNVLAHEEARCEQKLTHVLLNSVVAKLEHELRPFAVKVK